MRNAFELDNLQVETKNFAAKKAAWRFKGKFTCRHGVLFSASPPGGCKCMCATSVPGDWQHARFMPSISAELRTIIAIPFAFDSYIRLGALQSQLRQMDP